MALVLLEIAAYTGCNFAVIHFSDTYSYKTDIFHPEVYTVANKMAAEEPFLNGNTNFETPIWDTLRLMETEDFESADIVSIIDGQCAL